MSGDWILMGNMFPLMLVNSGRSPARARAWCWF